jgi:hypothetical protein
MTVVREHICKGDRNRKQRDRNVLTGCSEYDTSCFICEVFGDRNEERQMFGMEVQVYLLLKKTTRMKGN